MTSVRLFMHRFRRPLAAASAALAVLLLASALRPPAPDLVEIVVASIDLPGGSLLGNDDVETRALPREAVPPGSRTGIDDVTGRTLTGSIAAGEAVTTTRLLDTGPRQDGLRLVPVRLSDPEVAHLLSPGALVDLVQPSGDSRGRVIAEAVRVVTVPRRSRDGGLGSPIQNVGSLIVVAADQRTAIALATGGSPAGVAVMMR